MLRSQIYLPEELIQDLRWLAEKEAKPTSEVIRELLSEGLKKKARKSNAGDTLLSIAKIAAKGPTDLSTKLFDYLYGEKSDYGRRKRK